MQQGDTISAIATPQGEGGIGVIRISGEHALKTAGKVFEAKNGKPLVLAGSHHAVYGHIVDEKGQVVDEALALVMLAPHSYTVEDVVELQCHGGLMTLRKTLELTWKAGARPAERGEFTKRAFLNGRLDLSEAQAVMDIIQARTETSLTMAAGHLTGHFSKGIHAMRHEILGMIAHIEAAIDFPEDEVDDVLTYDIQKNVVEIRNRIAGLLQTAHAGRILRDGLLTAIIGKPNVGKSSLLNKILGEERVIVSNIAGTTRDAIDSYFENESGKFLFIDTAGMRRKSKVDDAVEKYSNLRSIAAIERADVCLILIDANEGVTEQDTKVAGLAHEAGKACIIVVNKWDTVEKDTNTMDEKTAEVRRDLSYMTYAPVVFISALTGQRVDKLFDMIVAVSNQNSMRITTGMLNNILEDATARVQPPTDKGRRLKIYYITQVGVKPPHFVFFCNDSRLFHFSYQRYLENQIRAVFGLTGTPIRITIRQKGDKEDM